MLNRLATESHTGNDVLENNAEPTIPDKADDEEWVMVEKPVENAAESSEHV